MINGTRDSGLGTREALARRGTHFLSRRAVLRSFCKAVSGILAGFSESRVPSPESRNNEAPRCLA
jgi:hypothetical protein